MNHQSEPLTVPPTEATEKPPVVHFERENGQSEEPVNTSEPVAEKQPEKRKQKSRETHTFILYNTEDHPEEDFVKRVLQARINAGLSRDWNHFTRQCIDFALNAKHVPGSSFAAPAEPFTPLKDAFFKPIK